MNVGKAIPKQRIESLIKQGLRPPEIAKALNISTAYTYELIKYYRIDFTRARKHTDEELEHLQELLNEGNSIGEAAVIMGLTYNMVKWMVHRYGLKTSEGNRRRRIGMVTNVKRMYYEDKMSIADIGMHYHLTEAEMKYYMEKHSIIKADKSIVTIPKKFIKDAKPAVYIEAMFRTCKQCGKEFACNDPGEWAYKLKNHQKPLVFFCSWHCIQAYRKDHEK